MVKVSKNKLRDSHQRPRAELYDLFAVVRLLYADARAFFQKTDMITHTCAMLCLVISHSILSASLRPRTVAHQDPLSTGILQARILK